MAEQRLLMISRPLLRGDDVRDLQQQLQALGYAVTDLDGIFGPEADRAVRAFQTASNLAVDGIVGPNTWAALNEATAQPETESDAQDTDATESIDSEPKKTEPDPTTDHQSLPALPVKPAVTLGVQPVRNDLLTAARYVGLALTASMPGTETNRTATRDLQRHLRALGYLRSGIDGAFGAGTENAIRALQYDLIHNDGRDAHGGPDAPVALADINNGRVTDITGIADEDTVACIQALIDDPNVPLLPFSEDPRSANMRVRDLVSELTTDRVPLPFLSAILEQESSFRHFNQPRTGDEDTYITVGLDTNDATHPYRITSRGYGAGQYTLFHHPPHQEEVERFMQSIDGNVQHAIDELREKYDRFIIGTTPGTRADDRIAEYGTGPLRLCKYASGDPRHLRDCTNCMREAGTITIEADVTPLHPATDARFTPTQYHRQTQMENVPNRSKIECDWPYAIRRYNGSGINSYWYQAEVLIKIAQMDI